MGADTSADDSVHKMVSVPGGNYLLWEFVPEAVGGRNDLLWPALFENGIATVAVWRDVDAWWLFAVPGKGVACC